MNRRKYLYALLIATVVVTSGCLVAAAGNTITRQWAKHFWVKEPRLPVECEIEIEGPKVVGYPVNISVTLRTEDENVSISLYKGFETAFSEERQFSRKDYQKSKNSRT